MIKLGNIDIMEITKMHNLCLCAYRWYTKQLELFSSSVNFLRASLVYLRLKLCDLAVMADILVLKMVIIGMRSDILQVIMAEIDEINLDLTKMLSIKV